MTENLKRPFFQTPDLYINLKTGLLLAFMLWLNAAHAYSHVVSKSESQQPITLKNPFIKQLEPALQTQVIIGENNLESILHVSSPLIRYWASAVARVERKTDNAGYCSAVRIAPRYFLTAYHCARICENIRFRLGYTSSTPNPGSEQVFDCQSLVIKHRSLDFALYTTTPVTPVVAPKPSVDPLQSLQNRPSSFATLTLAASPPDLKQPIFLVSHPKSRKQEIDQSAECRISDAVPHDDYAGRISIKHLCDSEGNSSGAPLISKSSGEVVGLHWGGLDNQFNLAVPAFMIREQLINHLDQNHLEELGLSSD